MCEQARTGTNSHEQPRTLWFSPSVLRIRLSAPQTMRPDILLLCRCLCCGPALIRLLKSEIHLGVRPLHSCPSRDPMLPLWPRSPAPGRHLRGWWRWSPDLYGSRWRPGRRCRVGATPRVGVQAQCWAQSRSTSTGLRSCPLSQMSPRLQRTALGQHLSCGARLRDDRL